MAAPNNRTSLQLLQDEADDPLGSPVALLALILGGVVVLAVRIPPSPVRLRSWGRLAGRVGWLAALLVGWPRCWSAGRVAGWLAVLLVGWLCRCMSVHV